MKKSKKARQARHDLVGGFAFWTPREVQSVESAGRFMVHVRIDGARIAFGRDELLISPDKGCAWVNINTVVIIPSV